MYPPIIAKASSIKWSFEEDFPFSEESLFDLYITTIETLAIGPLRLFTHICRCIRINSEELLTEEHQMANNHGGCAPGLWEC